MEEEEEVQLKFFQKTGFITIFLVFLPFLGIPLMWLLTKSFGVVKKILFSILFGVWAAIVIFVMVFLFLGFQSSEGARYDAYGLPINEEINWGYGDMNGTPASENPKFTMPDIDLSFLFGSGDDEEADVEGETEADVATEGEDVAETTTEAVVESQTEPEVETEVAAETEAVVETETETETETEVEAVLDSAPGIEIEIEIDPREVESA